MRLIPATVFLAVTYFLTFRIISLPYLVIGDNFVWTIQNILDILSSKIVYESYMGDIALQSTFKTAILLPVSYVFSSLNIPMTIIYPFMFYFLSMLSFYSFSGEFLEGKAVRVVVSVAYLVNPVTPYYYISMLNSFALIFLPLALKFFARALRDTTKHPPHLLSKNYAICSLFIGLALSAHAQFLPAIGILSTFLALTFTAFYLKEHGFSSTFAKAVVLNQLAYAGVILVVNLTAVVSLITVTKATFANYFTARFQDFLMNVYYTYYTSNLFTLLRFGGDSGAGLYQDAWFDSNLGTNIFGYAVVAVIVASALLLVLRRTRPLWERAFFYMNLIMFACLLSGILFIKYLPSDLGLAEGVFNVFSLLLMSFETPAKLRVLLLLSGLTTTLVGFRELEEWGKVGRRRVIAISLLCIFASSLVLYNSPWVIETMGFTPVKQISERLSWGDLYGEQYSGISTYLGENFWGSRGIIIPYTHKIELYSSPYFRIFQLLSNVNEVMASQTLRQSVSWSKLLGLLSVKHIVLNNYTDWRGWLLFPNTFDRNMTIVNSDISGDPSLRYIGSYGNYTLFENANALPITYATRNYVLYDDVDTLNYAFKLVDFQGLPVFIRSGDRINSLIVPENTGTDLYEVHALVQPDVYGSEPYLTVTNAEESRAERMKRTGTMDGLELYTVPHWLSSGDQLNVEEAGSSTQVTKIDEMTLNSTWNSLGDYTSFDMNFTVNMLERGDRIFLSPRVTLHPMNSTNYYMIIFQDSGFVELAMLRDNEWISGILLKYGVYDLTDLQNSIRVGVSRKMDEVEVKVNGAPIFTFPMESTASAVRLSSENSTSRFTNVTIVSRSYTRLFAVRHPDEQIGFEVISSSSEASTLVVNGTGSDYAVVTQYLETPSRTIDPSLGSFPFTANLFFNGWIVNPAAERTPLTELNIGIQEAPLTRGLTFLSIFLTYAGLLLVAVSLKIELGSRIGLKRWLDEVRRHGDG